MPWRLWRRAQRAQRWSVVGRGLCETGAPRRHGAGFEGRGGVHSPPVFPQCQHHRCVNDNACVCLRDRDPRPINDTLYCNHLLWGGGWLLEGKHNFRYKPLHSASHGPRGVRMQSTSLSFPELLLNILP